MGSLTHFVTWEVTPEELEALANELRKNPVISIKVSEDVELVIKHSQNLLPKLAKTSISRK